MLFQNQQRPPFTLQCSVLKTCRILLDHRIVRKITKNRHLSNLWHRSAVKRWSKSRLWTICIRLNTKRRLIFDKWHEHESRMKTWMRAIKSVSCPKKIIAHNGQSRTNKHNARIESFPTKFYCMRRLGKMTWFNFLSKNPNQLIMIVQWYYHRNGKRLLIKISYICFNTVHLNCKENIFELWWESVTTFVWAYVIRLQPL